MAQFVFICSCMAGTIVMLSFTRRWFEVAFFASFFVLRLLRWLAAAPPPPGADIGVRSQVKRLDVVFWIVIFATAVSQLWIPALASAPLVVLWVRFVTVLAWSFVGRREVAAR